MFFSSVFGGLADFTSASAFGPLFSFRLDFLGAGVGVAGVGVCCESGFFSLAWRLALADLVFVDCPDFFERLDFRVDGISGVSGCEAIFGTSPLLYMTSSISHKSPLQNRNDLFRQREDRCTRFQTSRCLRRTLLVCERNALELSRVWRGRPEGKSSEDQAVQIVAQAVLES